MFKSGMAPKTIIALTSIYGVLYLWFAVTSFFPSPEGHWIGGAVPYDPYDSEGIGVKVLFFVFLAGYFSLFKHSGIAGGIFILWWIAMWLFEAYVVEPLRGFNDGTGVALGIPLFIIGVFCLVHWFRRRQTN